MAQVENELVRLEEHWLGLNLEDELLDDLLLRKQYLREAIAIARESEGVVGIS